MQNRMRLVGLAVAAVTTMSVSLSAAPMMARADEATPTTSAEAVKLVEKLKAEQAELDKKFNDINAKVIELGGRSDAQRAQIETASKRVADMKTQLGAVALIAYQDRGTNGALSILTSADSNNFLSRVGTVDQVTANQNISLQELQAEQANIADLQRSLEANQAAAKNEMKKLEEADQAARAKVVAAQQVASRLQGSEKAKFDQEQAAATQKEAAAKTATASRASTAQERIAATEETKAVETTKGYTSPVISAGNNLYSWGQCTWWAFGRRAGMGRPVGSTWGNASNWPGSARAQGFAVDGVAEVGAAFIEYYAPMGHVSVVESISGGMMTVSEMNWNGGVGVLHYRTVPARGTFIH
ncbi:MAG: CHAP domain-containing protein [Propionibacteriaceae bacterium]